ncbi:hypothetical protein U91I_00938 [alpha proteobacterium U9-1i]|nr:hypothetical protein U91I_00938 [alpha proteobacterium U9-1i]
MPRAWGLQGYFGAIRAIAQSIAASGVRRATIAAQSARA